MAISLRRESQGQQCSMYTYLATWLAVISSGADHLPRLFWATFWIPMINMVTIPVTLLLRQYFFILSLQDIDWELTNTAERTKTMLRAVETSMAARLNTRAQQKYSENMRIRSNFTRAVWGFGKAQVSQWRSWRNSYAVIRPGGPGQGRGKQIQPRYYAH